MDLSCSGDAVRDLSGFGVAGLPGCQVAGLPQQPCNSSTRNFSNGQLGNLATRQPQFPIQHGVPHVAPTRVNRENAMKFMLTFTWTPDTKTRAEGVARFMKTGGLPPKGATLLGRWTRADFSAGYDLIETDDAGLLAEFAL